MYIRTYICTYIIMIKSVTQVARIWVRIRIRYPCADVCGDRISFHFLHEARTTTIHKIATTTNEGPQEQQSRVQNQFCAPRQAGCKRKKNKQNRSRRPKDRKGEKVGGLDISEFPVARPTTTKTTKITHVATPEPVQQKKYQQHVNIF